MTESRLTRLQAGIGESTVVSNVTNVSFMPHIPPHLTDRALTWFLQLAKYMKLDQKGKVLAEYIWIDGSNGLRNKTKVSRSLL